jgi:hypothetical protein
MAPLLRITGVKVATFDGERPVLEGQDIWISKGRISALLPAGSPPPEPGPIETLAPKRVAALGAETPQPYAAQ